MAIDILTELTNVTIKTPHLKVEEAAAAHVVPANKLEYFNPILL